MKHNWIKVTDKLPENENYVLVYDGTCDYDFAWYSKIKKRWYWNSFDQCEHKITHWQPLEKPE